MKTMLIYDTETTGLPDDSRPLDDPRQPHITQIAAQLCDEETGRHILGSVNLMIKPAGWSIPDEVAKLTGISTELADAYGVPIRTAIIAFLDLWALSDFRVAHNENFDMRMVFLELKRDIHPRGFPETWKDGAAFCTAESCTQILNLPPTARMLAAGFNKPKKPNLGEAYRFFTGKELVNAHNASVDLMGCKAVYFGIRDHEPAYANEGAA